MEAKLHPAIPREVTENLDSLLDDARKDFGFEQFDSDSSPQVYQGVAMLYFFALGSNVHKMNLPTQSGSLYDCLLKHLQTAKLIEPKPRNYQELRDTFQNLCSETSRYLTERV